MADYNEQEKRRQIIWRLERIKKMKNAKLGEGEMWELMIKKLERTSTGF